jgi:hypothetical protein
MVSAPVETAEPLDAVVLPLLPVAPIEFEAWLRAAFAVAEAADADDAAEVEHAPLVVEAVTMVEAAVVAVDEVMGAKVEDDVLDEDDEDGDVVVVVPASTAVGRLSDEDGVLAATEETVGDTEDVDDVVADVVAVVVAEVDEDAVLVVDVVAEDAVAEAGEHDVTDVTAVEGAPETVPAVALVVWVPLAVPPEVLTKMALRTSAFCQYCGAASITT